MTKDRNLYLSARKETDFLRRENLHIHLEMVWKAVKKFQETGKTCYQPGQGRKRTI